MKKWIEIGIFAVLVIGVVLMSGCTNDAGSSGATSTPTQQVVYVTVLVTPTPTQQVVYVVVPVVVSVTPTPKIKVVAVTAIQQGNNIVLTYQGGPDANMVSELDCRIGTVHHQWNSPKIGDSRTFSGATSGYDNVIVEATFTDGVHQVILDTML